MSRSGPRQEAPQATLGAWLAAAGAVAAAVAAAGWHQGAARLAGPPFPVVLLLAGLLAALLPRRLAPRPLLNVPALLLAWAAGHPSLQECLSGPGGWQADLPLSLLAWTGHLMGTVLLLGAALAALAALPGTGALALVLALGAVVPVLLARIGPAGAALLLVVAAVTRARPAPPGSLPLAALLPLAAAGLAAGWLAPEALAFTPGSAWDQERTWLLFLALAGAGAALLAPGRPPAWLGLALLALAVPALFLTAGTVASLGTPAGRMLQALGRLAGGEVAPPLSLDPLAPPPSFPDLPPHFRLLLAAALACLPLVLLGGAAGTLGRRFPAPWLWAAAFGLGAGVGARPGPDSPLPAAAADLAALGPAGVSRLASRLGGPGRLFLHLHRLQPPALTARREPSDPPPGFRAVADPVRTAALADESAHAWVAAPWTDRPPAAGSSRHEAAAAALELLVRPDLPGTGPAPAVAALARAAARRYRRDRAAGGGDPLDRLLPAPGELEELTAALAEDPDPWLLDYLEWAGEWLLDPRLQRLEEAAPFLEAWARLGPGHAPFLRALGTLRLRLLEYANAEIILRRALALAPGDQGAARGLGLACFGLGRWAEAAARLAPPAPDPRLDLEAARALALALHALRDPRARASVAAALAAAPGDGRLQAAARELGLASPAGR